MSDEPSFLDEADRIAARLAEELELDDDLLAVFDRTPLLERAEEPAEEP